jgi:hypothetical protein
MSVLWFDGLLAQTADDELLEAAAVNTFPCVRVNLRDCADRADLMLRLAGVLALPPHRLEDWSELPRAIAEATPADAPGLVLLVEHSEQLRARSRAEFKLAMEALQAGSAEWARRQRPLWSFIVLDEAEFDALD